MWDKIKNAARLILDGEATRVDGKGFTVYAVGTNIVRVDLRVDEVTDLVLSGQDHME